MNKTLIKHKTSFQNEFFLKDIVTEILNPFCSINIDKKSELKSFYCDEISRKLFLGFNNGKVNYLNLDWNY